MNLVRSFQIFGRHFLYSTPARYTKPVKTGKPFHPDSRDTRVNNTILVFKPDPKQLHNF